MQINRLSTNCQDAAKWGRTAQIQQRASVTAKNAMTDDFVQQVKALAKEDARKGIYMDNEYIQMNLAHMDKYVSPDRSGPMDQATKVLKELAKDDEDPLLKFLEQMLRNCSAKVQRNSDKHTFVSMKGMSGNCSAKLNSCSDGQTAEIYSPDGEMIACYNSNGDGWTVQQTQAESKFLHESTMVYKQAWDEARAEIKAAAQQPVMDGADEASFDIRA